MENHKKENLTTESERWEYLCGILKVPACDRAELIGKKFTVVNYPCCRQECEAMIMRDGFIILNDGSTVEPRWIFKQFRVKL